jgi:hypothetical protein
MDYNNDINIKDKEFKVQDRDERIIKAIKEAFGETPIACDGMIMVRADAYNKIVREVNKNE